MKPLLVSSAIVFSIAFVGTAEATILLSGDTSIINPTVGNNGQVVNSGNITFFTNILGNGGSVLVQQTSPIHPALFGNALTNFYDTIPGVSSVFTNTSLNSGALSGIDLFISMFPDEPFQTGELSQISDFLDGGGTVLFMGDHVNFRRSQNVNINSALASLGSTMRIQNTLFDAGFHTASGSQITNAPFTSGISSFRYAAPSELAVGNGTTLFFGNEGQPFVACEGDCGEVETTPEPSTLLGLGTLALASGTLLRRKHKA